MNHSIAEASPYSDWHDPDEGAGDRPTNGLRQRANGKKSGEKNRSPESRPKKTPRVIPSWKQPEATIWAREPEATPTAPDMPDVDRMQQYEHSAPSMSTPISSPQSNKEPNEPENTMKEDEITDNNWVHDFAGAPAATQTPMPSTPSNDHEWSDYSREEPSKYQHSFWQEPEIRRPNQDEHNTLPAVTSAEPAPDEYVEQADDRQQTSQTLVGLEDAVNPNLVPDQAAQSAVVTEAESTEQPSQVQTPEAEEKNLGRRPEEPEVQSTSMSANSNFEQLPSRDEMLAGNEEEDEPPSGVEDYYAPVTELEPALAGPESDGSAIENMPQEAWDDSFTAEGEVPMPVEDAVEPIHHLETEPATEYAAEAASSPETFVDHTLEHQDLLTLAKSIRINGVSVYEMFTAKRIDKEGLRHIVTEFLRGGDLKAMISQEVIRQQMKFERDPQLRDTPVKAATTKSAAVESGKRAADKIKQHAQSLRAKDRTERIADAAHSTLEKAEALLRERPNTIQAASIGAIVVIYLTILIVALVK